jgi:predicted dehydrogenase
MKQILQSPRSGSLEIVDVPAPAVGPGQILVRNVHSVMSPGTEKTAMDFARKSMLGKARSRPDLVNQVLRKLKHEGPLPTYRTVVNKLDAPQPLGYASAGVVEEVGPGVTSFTPGDLVACAGAGYANHAELVVVPENLTAHVPNGLSLEKAAFATLGAIAMQGLRVGDPSLGEVVVVIGLGLIGQLTVQLLLANGCRVYGIDLDPTRIDQARAQGMEFGGAPGDDHAPFLASVTGGHGADMAIVTAASDSSAPIQLAAELCRHKGRVVAVGATAMDLDRRTFYEKELELRMSMSYGPGRYDRRYEEVGLDYPIAYVRWTEQRNLQAFVDLAARGAIDPLEMDVESVPFEQATEVYEALAKGERKSLAAVFRYAEDPDRARSSPVAGRTVTRAKKDEVGIGFVGAGNYAKAVLLPILEKIRGTLLRTVVTSTGPSAQRTAERFGFATCGTDVSEVFGDDSVDLIFITTQHDTHSTLAEQALRAGKAVWLEKPVSLDRDDLTKVVEAVRAENGFLMVGYNRRFSHHARAVHDMLEGRRGAVSIQYVVAAGPMPVGTWIVDEAIGGGRVIGEVCHFVDLCTYLVGRLPVRVFATPISLDSSADDSLSFVLSYSDGSTASVSYLANAGSSVPKERWEVHCDGQTAICENFRKTSFSDARGRKSLNQDKGQSTAIDVTLSRLREGGDSPIGLEEIVSTSEVTFAILESIRSGAPVEL